MIEKYGVALITSFTALVVAIISAAMTIVVSRKVVQNSNRTESFKQRLSLILDDTKKTIGALGDGIREIQNIKEHLFLILASVKGSLDINDVRITFHAAEEKFIGIFNESNAVLNDGQRIAFHRAKGIVRAIAARLDKFCTADSYSVEDLQRLQSDLRRLRQDINEQQDFLRDCRADIIERIAIDEII